MAPNMTLVHIGYGYSFLYDKPSIEISLATPEIPEGPFTIYKINIYRSYNALKYKVITLYTGGTFLFVVSIRCIYYTNYNSQMLTVQICLYEVPLAYNGTMQGGYGGTNVSGISHIALLKYDLSI